MLNLLFHKYIVKLIFPQHVSPTYLQTYYVDHKTGVRTWDKPMENTGNEAATSQLPQTYLQRQQSNMNNIENLAEKLDLNNDEVQDLWILYNFDLYILMDDSASMNVAGKTIFFRNVFYHQYKLILIFQTINY